MERGERSVAVRVRVPSPLLSKPAISMGGLEPMRCVRVGEGEAIERGQRQRLRGLAPAPAADAAGSALLHPGSCLRSVRPSVRPNAQTVSRLCNGISVTRVGTSASATRHRSGWSGL
jgi:hypothetical protein